MNNFTKMLCAAALVTGISQAASAQTLYDNFETTRIVAYPAVEGTLVQNAPNPGSNTVNTSITCGAYTRQGSAKYAVLVVKPNNARMADVAAYATGGTKRISIKFRSPAIGVTVGAVLQNGAKSNSTAYPGGKFGTEFSAVTTKANEWEVLTFVPSVASGGAFDATVLPGDIDQMVFQVASGTNNADTYYLDDIMGPELVAVGAPAATAVLLDNFETTRLLSYPSADGTLSQTAPNPGSAAPNTSPTCASFARSAIDYATINITPKAGQFFDVSAYTANTQAITMKFRSPAIGTKVQLVLQNRAKATATPYNYPQGNFAGTFDATTTVANAWETLTFRFTAGAADASVTATTTDQLALLIAPNTKSADTFYFDDVTGPAITTVTATRPVSTDLAAFAPAYPNPTSGLTQLPFSLKQPATVSLAVYDNLGRRVAEVLNNELRPAGQYAAELNAAKLAPGFYTCRLTVNGAALSRALSVE